MTKLLGVLFAAFCLMAGLGQSAHAQTLQASAIALTSSVVDCTSDPSACLVIDGVTISGQIIGCQNGGVACPDLFLAPTSGPGASIIIEAATGDVPGTSQIESIFACSDASCTTGTYDLSVNINVSSTKTLTTVDGTLNGSYTVGTGDTSDELAGLVTMGENVYPGGNDTNNLCGGNGGEYLDLSTPSFSCTISQQSLSVSKDLGFFNTDGSASSLTLSSVVQSYVPAPEPASLATLLGGLVALGAVRRHRRRV